MDTQGQLLAVKVQTSPNPAIDEIRRRLATASYPYAPGLVLSKSGNAQAMLGELFVSVEEYIEHDSVRAHDATLEHGFLVALGQAMHSLHNVEISPEDTVGLIPLNLSHLSF